MTTRVLRRSWLLLTLLAVAVVPVNAIGPSLVMFYGGNLAKPVIQTCSAAAGTCTFLWNVRRGGYSPTTRSGGVIPAGLEGRAYVNVAIFWGPRDMDHLDALKPEDASQHARIYLPTKTDKAVVVATPPYMQGPNGTLAAPVPVPTALDMFVSGWTLDNWELTSFKQLGIPDQIISSASRQQ